MLDISLTCKKELLLYMQLLSHTPVEWLLQAEAMWAQFNHGQQATLVELPSKYQQLQLCITQRGLVMNAAVTHLVVILLHVLTAMLPWDESGGELQKKSSSGSGNGMDDV